MNTFKGYMYIIMQCVFGWLVEEGITQIVGIREFNYYYKGPVHCK